MGKKTILVIEDDALNIKLMQGILRVGKHDMIEAVDAETGIQLARQHRPDLILMDIQLPGMDGLSATRILKADPDLNQIPVIALTGFASEGDKEKALEAGCAGYITKPFSIEAFLKALENFFNFPGPASESNPPGKLL